MQTIGHVSDFVWLLVIGAVIASWVWRSNRIKGLRGELRLRFVAWMGLNGSDYQRFHNVMLRTPDGATQIDHVFVSRFGVFVVETKHIKGWIFGGEADQKWTRVLYGRKWYFQNPLRQNYKHAKAVETALGLDKSAIHSVVVFTARTSFKTAIPPHVTLCPMFVDHIKSFRRVVLTEEQVASLATVLQRRTLPKWNILRVRHIKLVRERQHQRQHQRQRSEPEAHRRCPQCGKTLAIRTARRGNRIGSRFWGCSGYPKCKYTQNVS